MFFFLKNLLKNVNKCLWTFVKMSNKETLFEELCIQHIRTLKMIFFFLQKTYKLFPISNP